MFNSPYLSQTLPYPFLSLFKDVSIPYEEEQDEEDEEQQEQENEESVAE